MSTAPPPAPATAGARTVFVRRWGAYLALTIVFAIACGLLSWWQWSRRAETVAEITKVQVNYDAPVAKVGSLLPQLDSWDDNLEWRPVTLHGSYLTADQLLARNRPLNGSPGFEVLTPLKLDDGTVFVVDRGWLPTGKTQDLPDIVPVAPSGEVTVVVRLKGGEPTLPGRTAPAGQIPSIHLDDVATLVGAPTYTGAYGLMDSETPAPADRPVAAVEPVADEGPHLSYAIQWIAFGLLAFAGLLWAFRRERRIARGEPAKVKKPPRERSDSDIEDELLDA